ncbi:hypothetical protein PH7735_01668 [Shimia thalassica]|uniref:Uncharacterized protein n=1 Tax=Shimia thalassica TaxID=1715693 RepID=A0A0P1IGR8_9RHOB|nr:hypothetical protein [Shimia thalassica]CUJ93800.1 hypothetical protein PH7735_01668 [Shimia thalassica]
MAAASEYLTQLNLKTAKQTRSGHTFLVRVASVVFGFGFIWAGAGLWFVPGLEMEPSILASKMVLSVLMVTAGVGMTHIATERAQQDLHFDPRHRQIHLVETLARGRTNVVQSINYEEIGRADVTDSSLKFLDHKGQCLLELPLDGPHARLDAIARLRSQALIQT